MALQFRPPNIPQPKSKTAAFTEGIQPGLNALSQLPSTIAYFQTMKQERDMKQRQMTAEYGTGAPAPMNYAPSGMPGSTFLPPGLDPNAIGTPMEETPEEKLARVGSRNYALLNNTGTKEKPTWIIDSSGKKVGELPPGVKAEKLPAPYQAVIPTYDTEGNVTGFTEAKPGTHVVGGGKPANPKLAQEKPKAAAGLRDTLREYDNMIMEAQAIKNDPSVGMATGLTKLSSFIPGTGSKRVAARLETLKSKTLLNVLSSLKTLSKTGASGFGQLSDKESETIKSSVSTLDRGLSKEDFQASIDRFVAEMEERKKTLQGTFDSTYGSDEESGAPDIGSMFQGHKVLSIKRID